MGVFYDHILFDFCPGIHAFLERHKTLRAVAKLFAYAALFFVVALVYTYLPITLDNAGWIPHSHDTPVWIQGDWLVGEYRTCQLMTTTPVAGRVLSQEARAELPRLLCGRTDADRIAGSLDEFENAMLGTGIASNAIVSATDNGDWSALDGYFHVLPVRYYGRIERPDKLYVSWRCQRESESLTCKALN